MEVWSSPTVWVGLAAVTAVVTVALAGGGVFERCAAPWIWAAWVMTPLLQALTSEYAPALLFTLVDATLLLVLGGLAWSDRRFWPGAVAAIQAAVLAVDLLRLLTPIGAWAYLTVLAAASYLLLAALLASTWSSRSARPA